MTIVKVQLFSKNNKARGWYLYMPIVEVDGKYFRCESVKTFRVITKNDLNVADLKITREISPEYYAANGLPIKK